MAKTDVGLRSVRGSKAGAALAGAFLAVLMATPAMAQAPAAADPNPGALTFSGAYDIPTIYMFRGIRQETDPGFTSWPYADLKIDFTSGDGAVKSSSVNFGVWNSLHTGSSGTGGSSEKLHYEEDFYAALNLGFAKAMTFTTQCRADASTNAGFTTGKEIPFKVASGTKTRRMAWALSLTPRRVTRRTVARSAAPTWSWAWVRAIRSANGRR